LALFAEVLPLLRIFQPLSLWPTTSFLWVFPLSLPSYSAGLARAAEEFPY